MIDLLREYIAANAAEWGLAVDATSQLAPIIVSNRDYDIVKTCHWAGTAILWYASGSTLPAIVTKLADSSLHERHIKECLTLQSQINSISSAHVYPRVYSVASIEDATVIFQEGVAGSSYSRELLATVRGPIASRERQHQVIEHQLTEMGRFFGTLQMKGQTGQVKRWGEWVYDITKVMTSSDALPNVAPSPSLLKCLREAGERTPIQQRMLIPDVNVSNIFEGPRFIDHVHRDIHDMLQNEPSVLDAAGFLIAYFRSSPIRRTSWAEVLASAVNDRRCVTKLGALVRELVAHAGMNPDDPEAVWTFLIGASLVQIRREREVYGCGPKMRIEWHAWISEMLVQFEHIIRGRQVSVGQGIISKWQDSSYCRVIKKLRSVASRTGKRVTRGIPDLRHSQKRRKQ